MRSDTAVPELVGRLSAAINGHDLDGLVACFAEDVVSEQPAHPSRSFRGNEQVRANWTQLFAGLPDLRATLVRWAQDGNEVWTEWDWAGTRGDGAEVRMRGVTIQGIADGRCTWVRFFMEPLIDDESDNATVIRERVASS